MEMISTRDGVWVEIQRSRYQRKEGFLVLKERRA